MIYFIISIIIFIILNILVGILHKENILYKHYKSYLHRLIDEYEIGSLSLLIISLLWPVVLLILLTFIINRLIILVIGYILKLKQ